MRRRRRPSKKKAARQPPLANATTTAKAARQPPLANAKTTAKAVRGGSAAATAAVVEAAVVVAAVAARVAALGAAARAVAVAPARASDSPLGASAEAGGRLRTPTKKAGYAFDVPGQLGWRPFRPLGASADAGESIRVCVGCTRPAWLESLPTPRKPSNNLFHHFRGLGASTDALTDGPQGRI